MRVYQSVLINSSKESPLKIAFFAIFFFLITQIVNCQDCDCLASKNDSIREKYKTSCFTGDSKLLEEALAPLKKDNSVYCKQQILNWQAQYYNHNNDATKSKRFLDQEEKLLKQYPCLQNQALFYSAKGYYFFNEGLLDSVVNTYLAEIKIYDVLNKLDNKATSLLNLSVVFTRLDAYDKAHYFIKKASVLEPKIEDVSRKSYFMSGVAGIYSELYAYYKDKPFLDTAYNWASKSIELSQNVKGLEYMTFESLKVHQLKAFVEGNITKSIEINNKRKSLLNPAFHVRELYQINTLIAERYKDNQQYEQANKLLDSSKYYASKMDSLVSYEWYKIKYEAQKGLGNYRDALLNYEHYIVLHDSMTRKERFDKINELETKYRTELKDAKIKSLNQQKRIDDLALKNKKAQLFWFFVTAIAVFLFMLLYFRHRSLKNQQKILEIEQRLNRARINPHFFFNGMASLQSLSLQEGSPKTTMFISRFAKIMRQSLESTYEELTKIEEELDFLTQYLEVQKLRYPEKFDYEFHIEENLETDELKIPGMLLQPFVENAIEHGFKDIDYMGKINIAFRTENDELLAIVEDNGVGLSKAYKKDEHTSRAMQIVKDRLYLFNKQNNSKAFYKTEQSETNKGFIVIVILPKIYEK